MMEIFIIAIVVTGSLFVIGSGVWVAIALARNLSANRNVPEAKKQ